MSRNTWREGEKRTEPDCVQGCPGMWKEAVGTNRNTAGSLWTSGITSLLWGWPSTGTGCPERLWSLPPCLLFCRYSKATWTWSWATASRRPCLDGPGGRPDDILTSLPTSTILWSYTHSVLTCCQSHHFCDQPYQGTLQKGETWEKLCLNGRKIHFHVTFGASSWSLPGLPKMHFYCLDGHFQPDKSEWAWLGIIINTSPLRYWFAHMPPTFLYFYQTCPEALQEWKPWHMKNLLFFLRAAKVFTFFTEPCFFIPSLFFCSFSL